MLSSMQIEYKLVVRWKKEHEGEGRGTMTVLQVAILRAIQIAFNSNRLG